MSLRDELLKKGLASKGDARRVEQERERERRAAEGNRRRKAEEEASAAARAAAEAEARAAARRAARSAYEEARERTERALQVRNLVSSNAVRTGGPIRFFHRIPGTARLGFIGVGAPVASGLQRGEVAITALPLSDGFSFHVVRRSAAERLAELAPHLVVFWNRDPTGTSAPDQQPLERRWESALGPRRATEADLARWRISPPAPPDRSR